MGFKLGYDLKASVVIYCFSNAGLLQEFPLCFFNIPDVDEHMVVINLCYGVEKPMGWIERVEVTAISSNI